MAEIVISIVGKVAELLVVPVGKHICYPFKYKSNMDELKKQVEKLTAARDRVQHSIEEAERQRHEIESDVKNWLNSVDEFTEGVVKNIIGGDDDEDKENKAKKLCSIGFCPNLMARYSLSKKAEKTAKDGVNLLKEGKYEKVSYCPDIQRTSSIYNRGYNDFDSRTSIFQDIMQTLADDNFNIIGVHGMGGVGKTTLVKRVVGKAIDDKLFDVVVMADITQTPDIKNIQAQIADVLDLKFEVESLSGRAARLRVRLKKEKRVLLVLDDLWKKLDLEEIGIPLGEGGNAEQRQCKLLLTSRDLHVLRDHMNTHRNFQLKILTDEEAGNLFWQIVGDSTITSDFDTTGVEIIRRCAGLPVAIATIASALKNQDHFAWEDALDQLKKYNPRHIEGMKANVYSAIKWSYDFLQSEEAKSVFLLCSLYNASFNIDIDYLLQYCIGLGVFQGVSTMEQARNRLQTIINKLKASHLLLNGNTNMCVKLHDIVHAVATSIASEDKLMSNIQDVTDLKETLEVKLPKNSTAMSLPFKDVSALPERLEFPKLELLVLLMEHTSLQIPDPFFEGMEGLKVLHLNEFHMLSLPSSLCRLTSLQTLRLNQCLLGDIAVIGALKRIEILSFLSSTIEQLPRDISQLTRLRLLDLRNCSNLKVISPNLISSLTRLEELYMGNSFVGWDVEGRSNASLAELKQLSRLKRLDICVLDARIITQDLLIFEKLESCIICIGEVWNRFDYFEYQWILKSKLNDLDNYFESSRMLKLKLNDSNIYLGNEIRHLLNRTEVLHLCELNGVKNVVYQLNGEGFPQLKHLYVKNDPVVQYIISAIGSGLCNVFPKLESLLLSNLINLKKICHGQLALESFNKLRIMKVQKCDTLNHLFSFSMVKNLSQLQEIEVTNCEKLEVIIFKESEEQVHQNDRISRVEFTQLRTLTLQNLPWLTSFVLHSLAPNTESQEIVFEDQPRGFMSLFSQNVAFLCLKELKLHGLPKLLHLWKEDSQPMIVLENLTNLDVSFCQNLKTLGPSLVPLEKLTTLTVKSCNGLMNLMTLSTAKTLEQLKTISIEQCDMLEEIITDVGEEEIKTAEAEKDATIDKITLSMLNSITLDCLPNLITFHSGSNTLECPSLTHIHVRDCPKMETFVFPNTKNPSVQSASLFNEKVAFPCLKELTLQQLPQLLYLWKEDSQTRIGFENLTNLNVSYCENLKTLVPFSVPLEKLTTLNVWSCDGLMNLMTLSTAKTLVQLKTIIIEQCDMLEEIITDVGEEEIKTAGAEKEAEKDATIDKITLSMLNSISLDCLPNLITFHSGSNTLECPSLTHIYIRDCPKMETFVFPNKKNPSIRSASLFNEKVAFPCLKELTLNGIPELLHLWKEDSQPRIVFENLTNLNVSYCENLKTLMPFSVPLEKLTTLTVWSCNGLMNLMTLSTAKTLVQLQTIIIEQCKMLEEIITDVGEEEIKTAEAEKEAEKDAAIDKITLSMLNSIALDRLPNLITFHSGSNTLECPSLTNIDIKYCPKMEAFVFPDTKDPSIRSASLFNEKVAFPCLKELRLQQLPELLHLWKEDSQPRKVFENLTNLNVSYCENLKTLVSFSVPLEKLTTLTVTACNGLMNLMTLSTAKTLVQLKKITIEGCRMLEEIITDVGDDEIRTAEAEKDAAIDKITLSLLNSITLFFLPNLITFYSGSNTLECPSLTNIYITYCPKMEKFVFPNRKAISIRSGSHFSEVVLPILASLHLHGISIQHLQAMSSCPTNLTRLTVVGCDNLKYLFPSSMAESLVHLGFLHISNCKLMKVVIITQEERKSSTLFPKLKKLILEDLPELRTFCCFTGNLIKLPSLNKLHIKNCPTMQTFASDSLCADMLAIEELEEVNTEKEENLPSFFDEKVALPCLKGLRLRKLPGLLHLWKENSQPSKVFENLSHLKVVGCGNLTTLLTSTMSLQNLMTLEVHKCDRLIHLVPFSTAQSLKQLTEMNIIDCKMIEEILIDMGDEVKDKIVFDQLISLELHGLPSLTSFCKWNFTIEFPSLTQVFVMKCLKMTSFSRGVLSTPKLQRLNLKSEVDERDDVCCEGDLNTSIQQFFEDMNAKNSE